MTGPLQYRTEGDASHEYEPARNEPVHHEGTESMADGSAHEPGPSFVDTERPTDRLTEMPAWLQRFAAQQSDEDEDTETDPTPTVSAESNTQRSEDQSPEGESPDPSLPDWLRGDENQPREAPMAEADVPDSFDPSVTTAADSFISEDDLPDWLRAFSEEVAETTPPTSGATARTVTRFAPATQSMGVRVPPVENVWLSAFERQALGPGATLFALLASNTADVEADAQTRGASAPSADRRSGAPRAQSESATEPGTSDGKPEAQASSRRWLLLTLLLVLIVILISVWQFS